MVTPANPHVLFTRIQAFSTKHQLVNPGSTIIVGLSGGPDSVFLLHFLATIKKEKNLKIIAAHLDHGWRAESGEDVIFCKKIADELSIPFFHVNAKNLNLPITYNGSKEEVGRKLRRHFFEQLVHQHGANYVALAHHADDQQETFFIRLMRGATLTGLTGIKPKDGLYVRPLLALSKQEILDYLHTHTIEYLTDSTNSSPDFLRNRIRAHVVPAMRTTDERFDQNFNSTLAKLQETEQFLSTLTTAVFEQIVKKSETEIILDLNQWRTLDPFLQQRLILHWLCKEHVPFTVSDAFVKEIVRFLDSPRGGEHVLNVGWRVVKKNQQARIKRTSI